VPAIHCAGCAATIDEALEPVEGVESTSVDTEAKTVRVSGSADDRVIRKVLTAAGYPPA
jgi:copper chaperone CopZ